MTTFGRASTIDFAIGGVDMNQTKNSIREMLCNVDDDLLVVGYGYFGAQTLDSLGIGEWLLARPGRHVMLVLGINGKAPLSVHRDTWAKACDEFNSLLKLWTVKGVPLGQVEVYAVAHWHVKIAATLRSWPKLRKTNFSAKSSNDYEEMVTFDEEKFVGGVVTEAVIGSTNATFFAMDWEGNFELDVHIMRTKLSEPTHLACDSRPELGQLNSKIHSLLKRATASANSAGTVSGEATNIMRASLKGAVVRSNDTML